MQPYPSYQKINQLLTFTDTLPKGWEVHRAKYIFKDVDERSKTGNETLLSVSERKGVVPRNEIKVTMFQAEDYTGYKLCKPGDVVVNTLWAWSRGIGVSSHLGIVSTAYGVFRLRKPDEWNTKFLHYMVRSNAYVGEYIIRSKGIWRSRLLLSSTSFMEIPIIQPPLKVQNDIVRFMERKQAEIESLIEKKNRLLSVLKEERLAIINKYLPADGKTIKIKYLLNGIIDTEHKTVNFEESGNYLVVRTSNIKDGNLTLNNAKYTDEKGFRDWTRRGIPKPGDLLLTREAPAGEACIVPDKIDLCIGQRVVWLQVNTSKLDPTFALHSIYATPAQKFIYDLSGGSTVAHLNMSEIGNIPVLDISPDEQKAIGKKINRELDRIEKVNQKTLIEIEKSTELLSWYFDNLIRGQFSVNNLNNTSYSIAAEPNSEYGIKEQ